jgi:hypothetical protein
LDHNFCEEDVAKKMLTTLPSCTLLLEITINDESILM